MTQRQAGILADADIAALFTDGLLSAPRALDADQIQPASLDLRLGTKAYRVRASFMPGPGTPVVDKLERLKLHEVDLTAGAVLETGCVYIVPLLEGFALSPDLSASANPKSSTGRLDIFTRVIADGAQEFDKVPPGYRGPLYLEVSPRTFPIVVRTGSRLTQIRFRKGRAQLAEALRRDYPGLPIILSTGYAELPDGGDPGLPRLSKPFSEAQLIAILATVLGEGASGRGG